MSNGHQGEEARDRGQGRDDTGQTAHISVAANQIPNHGPGHTPRVDHAYVENTLDEA